MASLDVIVTTPEGAPDGGRVGVIVFHRAPADYYKLPVREEWGTAHQFRLEDLAAGRYLVFARSEQLAPSGSVPITLAEHDRASIGLELQKPGSVLGRVLRASDGAPVAGAVVYPAALAGVISTRSDRDGRFELAQVPIGQHDIVVAHESLVWKVLDSVRVDVDRANHVGDIRLGAGGSVDVVLLKGGSPVAGERIFLRCPYGPTKVGVTDSSGRFAFRGVPSGKCVVMKGLELHERVARSVNVSGASVVALELRLDSDLPIQGRVLIDGEPATGVLVNAVHASPGKGMDSFVMDVTDESGEFVLEGARRIDGPYLLTFLREIDGGFASFVDVVRQADASHNGGARATTFTFPGGGITGSVRDPQARGPVEGAEIKAIPKGPSEGSEPDRFQRILGGRSTSAVKSNGAGAFALRHLAEGHYAVVMSKPGCDTASIELDIREGSVLDIGEVALRSAGRIGAIDGRVYGPQGEPVRALLVLLKADGTPVGQQTHSDLGGRFAFEMVPAGDYTISAEGETPGFTQVEKIVVDGVERKTIAVNLAAP